jgi:glycosyltransferase involved in cell wall biosynthesis
VVGGIATWTRYFLAQYDREKISPLVLDTSKRYEEIGKASNMRGTFLGVLNSVRLTFRVMKLALREKPRLVYITCSGYWSFFTRDLMLVTVSKGLGLRTLVHLRGGHAGSFFGYTRLTRWLSRQILGRADRIVVITRDLENHARSLYAAKTVYLPNMLDEAILTKGVFPKPAYRGEGIKALHLAWQSPAKGSHDIIEACALLKDKLPGFTCDLVGKAAPEHEASILQKIRSFGLENTVRLRKETVGEEKWKYLREADIFLFPSHTEGFPNVILEAMSFGLPIIASGVGNIREMVGWNTDQEAALVLENENPILPDELASLIMRLASDPVLRGRMGANGRRRVQEKYLTGIVVPQIEELILRTAQGRRASEGSF